MFDHLYCPVCQDETVVELLPCTDGHGEDCAERICTTCSAVLFAGMVPAAGLRQAS